MEPVRPITIEAMQAAKDSGISAYVRGEDITSDPYAPKMKDTTDRDELHTLHLSSLIWRIWYRNMREKATA